MPDNQYMKMLEREGMKAVANLLQALFKEVKELKEEIQDLKKKSNEKGAKV